jgi:hypothetical protein
MAVVAADLTAAVAGIINRHFVIPRPALARQERSAGLGDCATKNGCVRKRTDNIRSIF